MNIRIITSAVLGTVLSFALPAASYAEDNVIRDGGTVIYTDGFKVVSSSSAGAVDSTSALPLPGRRPGFLRVRPEIVADG